MALKYAPVTADRIALLDVPGAHLVDVGAVFRGTGFAFGKEVDIDRFPIGADEIEHQGNAIGVAGLSEAIELVFGHRGLTIEINGSVKTALGGIKDWFVGNF